MCCLCTLGRWDQIPLPQNSASSYQKEQGLEPRLLSNILISWDNSSCRKSNKGKTWGSEAAFFHKGESWNFLEVANFKAQCIFCKWVYSAVELQTWCAVRHAKFFGEQSYANTKFSTSKVGLGIVGMFGWSHQVSEMGVQTQNHEGSPTSSPKKAQLVDMEVTP